MFVGDRVDPSLPDPECGVDIVGSLSERPLVRRHVPPSSSGGRNLTDTGSAPVNRSHT